MKSKILSALLLTSAIVSVSPLSAQEAQAPAATHVDVYVVPPAAQMPITLEYPALLKSIRSATVVSRISGVLEKKFFTEGSYIKKGALLYRIEPDIYAALVHERQADLAFQQSVLTKTKRDWERAKSLYTDKAISLKEHDAALSSYETSVAEVNAAKAKLASARVNLNYTDVRAPISGIAGMKSTDLGNVVNPGTPLVTITQTNPIQAEFAIPEVDFIKAQEAEADGSWGKSFQKKLTATLNVKGVSAIGRVDYVSPVIDQRTSSVQARALFENKKGTLLPGSFGRVKIEGIVRNGALTVPQKAILQNPLGTIVFVVEEGKAAARPVVIGDTSGENFIVKKGLKSGDTVIVNNFFRVRPGAAVAIDKTINGEVK
jgi:membrane fusion protein (multidrug efflux system)